MEGFDSWARVQIGRTGPQISFTIVPLKHEARAYLIDHDIGRSVTKCPLSAERVVNFLVGHIRACMPGYRMLSVDYLGTDHLWYQINIKGEKFQGYQHITSKEYMTPAQARAHVDDMLGRTNVA